MFFSVAIKAQITNPFGNALIPDMVADASIQEINGVFYCYATTDGYDKGLESSGPPVVWTSLDFVHWSFKGTYFPSAQNQLYWAPSKVVLNKDKYYIYPTVNGYIYPAMADKPEGPFKVAGGKDEWYRPFTPSTLFKSKNPGGIDAEVFVDDDQKMYVYWGGRQVARLSDDMINIDTNTRRLIETPRKEYSEGPIFFKRNGIYYYLYTIGGDEKYQYAYVMSKTSPTGPFFAPPKNDIITTTNYSEGLFGPGHGSVFNVSGTQNYYMAYLEFGRRSTNRQTYVNKLEFNDDGTIKPLEINKKGVGFLKRNSEPGEIGIKSLFASSVRDSMNIVPMKDPLFKRSEHFIERFAADGANGSRWMSKDKDPNPWLIADLGSVKQVKRSSIYFVRATAGHAYELLYSNNGKDWTPLAKHQTLEIKSPHTDQFNIKCRYLKVKILDGISGIWEWNVF